MSMELQLIDTIFFFGKKEKFASAPEERAKND